MERLLLVGMEMIMNKEQLDYIESNIDNAEAIGALSFGWADTVRELVREMRKDKRVLLTMAEVLPLKNGSKTCKWTPDPDHEISVWDTSCGESFAFDDSTPKEAGCIYCNHCGKLIEFVNLEEKGEE